MNKLASKAMAYGLVVLLGLLSALPNFLPETMRQSLPGWYAENQLTLGLDLRGGSYLLLEVEVEGLRAGRDEALLDDVMAQTLEVVRRRLDESGLVEPIISRQGRDRIEVQLPGVTEPQRIRELLGTTAKMSFHWLAEPGQRQVLVLRGEDGESYRLEQEVAMEGRHVQDARVGYDQNTLQPVVNFRLDNEGGRQFADMTRRHLGRQLAVVLDDRVVTAPVIRTAITGGSGEISGGFTAAEAADLAIMLRAGALPADLSVLEGRTVGASLGSDSIRMGAMAGIAGGLLVLAFMVTVYGAWGLIAWAGLAINVGLILGVLSLLGGTLTLPGIAGIILGIGMAVDANILINERIREETRQGKSARQALEAGFGKAWATILDSSVTTLIAISLLMTIGSGPVRGFATTIGIGVLTSMFTAIGVTRLIMEWRIAGKARQQLQISGLGLVDRLAERYRPGGKVIPFMRAGMAGLVVSAVLSTASLGLMVKPGMEYGIDFSGGALLEVQADNTGIEDLRAAFAGTPLQGIAIQEFGDEHEFQLRLPVLADEEDSGAVIEAIKQQVLLAAPDAQFSKADTVSPRISGDFAHLSILAVISAGLGMMAYLWLRFENHFALAAILTIALDITKTIGFFVITGLEFNLSAVAALLALIGYSVNDKVVVFDRIRENLLASPDRKLATVLDQSITTTLTRTLMTSGSTFLAILPMALAGGPAVASFAWPMLFGIVVGTSSSIFIAAPILLWLGKRRERQGLPQIKVMTEEEIRAEMLRP